MPSTRKNFPGAPGRWEQPIINQPEIGILGIVTKVFDGVRYFLMQAKMEPGNINLVQLSPTLQATKSNFTQVHRGRRPLFLEYFLEHRSKILVDQLQSEQGSRFLKKRNRNMILEVEDEIPDHPDFRWLTLAELKWMLAHREDQVNMDARTVLSCIPYVDDRLKHDCRDSSRQEIVDRLWFGQRLEGSAADLMVSLLAYDRAVESWDGIISWFTHLKTIYELSVESIPLNQIEQWVRRDGRIEHLNRNFFSVIGVAVEAAEREVPSWTQPILKHQGLGLVGFLTQKIGGVLHFLIQGKVEPGMLDVVEMAPTVSIFDIERRREQADRVPFFPAFLNAPSARIRYSRVQSEEGGRFYHLRNRYMVIEVPPEEKVEVPENFLWMTLGQMLGFIRYNNYFNIEARGLLSCLGLLVSDEEAES